MNQRRGSLGWIVAGLGLLLCCCLLPYLISSIYSVASTLLQVPAATKWLWGDWLSGAINPNDPLYRLVVEAPICCGGALGLLLTVLGIVWVVNGRESEENAAAERSESTTVAGTEATPESTEAQEAPYQEIDRATW
jgi:TRAP-type C4-dicarboxylate transport system permease small subunit